MTIIKQQGDRCIGHLPPLTNNFHIGDMNVMAKPTLLNPQEEVNSKKCIKCGEVKPYSEFHKKSGSSDGYRSKCKECRKIPSQQYYQKNKDKIKKRTTEYNRNNRGKHRTSCRKYHHAHNEIEKQRHREYYLENKTKCIEDARALKFKRYHTDIKFKLSHCISESMRRALFSNKDGVHWETLTGYSAGELKRHLERQFKDGMNWENHGKGRGKWHIDHIIPMSVFNFTNIRHADFKRCWALSNLQPMWAEDNSKKGNKLKIPFQPLLAFERGN